MVSDEEKARRQRKKDQDEADRQFLINKQLEKRDQRRIDNLKRDAAAQDQQRQLNSADADWEVEMMDILNNGKFMPNEQLEGRIEQAQKRHGGWFFKRSLTGKEKNMINKVKKMKKRKKGWWS